MAEPNTLICTTCGKTYALTTRDWRCACGGLFDLKNWPTLDATLLDADQPGLWRYRAWLPLAADWPPVALGEGGTPLLHTEWAGRPLHFKLEHLSPTGSFKDRGAAVLITALRGLGIDRVVEDSSGNAGAALAAYTARAGLTCEVCVPASAAGPKLAQMVACGAEVIEIRGRREYAALAAWAAAAHGAYYASHVYNPYFRVGIETAAYELWEQLGRRAPGALVIPTGNGTLLLGLHHGFQRLHLAGLSNRLPRLFAVQAAACAPIYRAFAEGRSTIEPVASEPSVATGIAIAQPAHSAQILAVVRATGGSVLSVTEEEITEARTQLAHAGFYVEPTSAAAVAALAHLPPADEPLVVPLTGHGLKSQAEA
jgi:threonine synthase